MGIKNFTSNLKKRHTEVYKQCYLNKFAGHRICIDISIFFYKFKNGAIKQTLYSTDLAREKLDYEVVTSHWLQKFKEQIMLFVDCDIMPIPVFDGPHLRLKADTKLDRRKKLEKTKDEIVFLEKQIEDGESDTTIITRLEKHLKNALWITPKEIKLLKILFDEMGVYYIQSNTEAERHCAHLCRTGYCSATFTTDSDAFAYRIPIIITETERKTRLGKPFHKCTYVVFENVLKSTNMTEEEFVDFCILCGTDYNDNLAFIKEDKEKPTSWGFKKAYDAIMKYETIEVCIKEMSKQGYVAGFSQCKDYIEMYGSMYKKFFDKLRKKKILSKNDITYPKILKEIRGYFWNAPVFELERFPVHFVNGDIKACFEEIFIGPNKERLLQGADKVTKKLKEFEIRFVDLQIFVLIQ